MFLQDLRYGLRRLAKSPGFTVVAILTLALGIGANTAIFSVVNGVLINPLPFRNADRIVSVFEDMPDFAEGSISYPVFLDWQRENRSFESMAAYRWANGTITGAGQPENVRARCVSAAFFPILGVNPILGRNFNAEDDRRGADPTVLISEGLWQRKFGRECRCNRKAPGGWRNGAHDRRRHSSVIPVEDLELSHRRPLCTYR